ncbi:hypothetical protein ABZ371_05055 [Streptomyces sp. NPDC005899]|uniref:hypothetical protein n=1 Tax=Streptomyces sp. NPDC005899 TaxID=3155716 RepID=UPI0033D33705
MRMLLIARLDTETANRAVAEGTLEKIIGGIVEHLEPEAAYFTPTDGQRSCLMVFDMEKASQMPAITEPLFRAGAKVTLQPVMNLDDLRTGLGGLKV